MTCAANCITVRKRCPVNLTLFLTWLCLEERHESRRLEADPDAVDDHNFLCALLCSSCSTTRCCIAFWTIESISDFFRLVCRNSLCMPVQRHIHTGFSLEFPSARRIANEGGELHAPFPGFCLETYKLQDELITCNTVPPVSCGQMGLIYRESLYNLQLAI